MSSCTRIPRLLNVFVDEAVRFGYAGLLPSGGGMQSRNKGYAGHVVSEFDWWK